MTLTSTASSARSSRRPVKTVRDILLRLVTTRVAWPIVITIGLLCTVSVLALGVDWPEKADRQKIHIAIGCVGLLLMLIPHFQNVGRAAYALFGVGLVMLAAVFWTEPINHSQRWFQLTESVQLQPSELAKLGFVLSLAWYLRYRKDIGTLRGMVVPFLMMLAPFLLIVKEPDLGTALLFPCTLYTMMIAAGAKLRHLLAIALIVILAAPGAFPLLQHYQQDRIRTVVKHWFYPDAPDKNGRRVESEDRNQQMRSLSAIGSGGLFGEGAKGALYAKQVPFAYTDFIFAVIGAQWGLAGCLGVLVLYLAFFAASIEIAGSTKDSFGRLLVVGLASMVLFQAVINISMTIALAPVVGIARPFVSYGGSSLLVNMLAAGLLLNVSIRRQMHVV